MSSETIEIKVVGEDDELVMQFPEDLLASLGWEVGDDLKFIDNKDGSFTVKKVEMAELELEWTEDEYFEYLKAAHEADKSFNDWVAFCLQEFLKGAGEND
jgi:hypothetical protein